jgi:hypothetical protein
MRREPGLPSQFLGDFINNATSKYGSPGKKSTSTASTPALIEFICIQEHGSDDLRFGVFYERHPDADDDRWIIARIPASWGAARSTGLAKPSPDGNGAERPGGLLEPFDSADKALRIFKTLTQPGR